MNGTDKVLSKYNPKLRYLIFDAIADVDLGKEPNLKSALEQRGIFMEDRDIRSITWEMIKSEI